MEKSEENSVLEHLLLVPHGIRLYSERVGCSSLDAYDATSLTFKELLHWVFVDYNIKTFTFIGLTLNAMQTRSDEELTPIIEIECTVYEDPEFIAFLKKNSVKVTFKGNFSKLPKYYKRAMKNLEKLTENHDQHELIIMIGYGLGKKSLFQSIKKRLFRDIFAVKPPDFMVSTAGRGFDALFESIPEHTKTLVVDKYFPDLTKTDIGQFVKYYKM
jgi:undecaprenyl pyrophosphate synthase